MTDPNVDVRTRHTSGTGAKPGSFAPENRAASGVVLGTPTDGPPAEEISDGPIVTIDDEVFTADIERHVRSGTAIVFRDENGLEDARIVYSTSARAQADLDNPERLEAALRAHRRYETTSSLLSAAKTQADTIVSEMAPTIARRVGFTDAELAQAHGVQVVIFDAPIADDGEAGDENEMVGEVALIRMGHGRGAGRLVSTADMSEVEHRSLWMAHAAGVSIRTSRNDGMAFTASLPRS